MRPLVASMGPAVPTDAVASKGRQPHNVFSFFIYFILFCFSVDRHNAASAQAGLESDQPGVRRRHGPENTNVYMSVAAD